MHDFTFATAAAIHFGTGTSAQLPGHSHRLGERPFVVVGANPERTASLTRELAVVGTFSLAGEPTFDDAREAVQSAREVGADHVIGIGGGAVLDLAKAVAILAVTHTDPLEHAEVIGGGLPLPDTGLAWIAVPTTAGTGSEVTSNAVLASPEHKVKVSLRSPSMLATVAIVDPELTISCPPGVTAQSGADALTQCLEPLTSRFANPMVDALAMAGLRAASRGLVRASLDGSDVEARTEMSFCSLMGGLALANAKLGAVHGLAGALGGTTGVAHGAICAALLLPVTQANIAAMVERDRTNFALGAYADAAEVLTGSREHQALFTWLADVRARLAIPGLGEGGLRRDDHDAVVVAAMKSSSMRGNPIDLTESELLGILQSAT